MNQYNFSKDENESKKARSMHRDFLNMYKENIISGDVNDEDGSKLTRVNRSLSRLGTGDDFGNDNFFDDKNSLSVEEEMDSMNNKSCIYYLFRLSPWIIGAFILIALLSRIDFF